MLTELQRKFFEEVSSAFEGTCTTNASDWEIDGLTEDDVWAILEEANIHECEHCGWYHADLEYYDNGRIASEVCHWCYDDLEEEYGESN